MAGFLALILCAGCQAACIAALRRSNAQVNKQEPLCAQAVLDPCMGASRLLMGCRKCAHQLPCQCKYVSVCWYLWVWCIGCERGSCT